MSKILIPFSGGINSTYALWRYLNETDHEIHSYRHTESFEAQDRKRTAALAMVDWLKANVRDFTFWEESGTLEQADDQHEPSRIGFTQTWNVGWILPRWEKQAQVLDSVQWQKCGDRWARSLLAGLNSWRHFHNHCKTYVRKSATSITRRITRAVAVRVFMRTFGNVALI